MSYTRHFSKSITVHYSGSVSYPASKSGGTRSYSGSVTETVHFNVTVDTNPFDRSVDSLSHGVDVLTGSVVATEAAQVKSIADNSRKVGQTIISGFFKTVRSDISQQIAELSTRIEALVLQLKSFADRCHSKQQQMHEDYNRLSSRYVKIFDELNRELENRIFAIDEPVFRFQRALDAIGSSPEHLIGATTVTAVEQATAHSTIATSLLKHQAAKTIGIAGRFLRMQYDTDNLLGLCLRRGGEQLSIATPYCVVESVSAPNCSDTEVYASPMLAHIDPRALVEKFESTGLRLPRDKRITEYFNDKIAQSLNDSADKHNRRVIEMTNRLFTENFSNHE